ncbi:beta-N-acetylhexosaminidase [Myxococcota bacterium]
MMRRRPFVLLIVCTLPAVRAAAIDLPKRGQEPDVDRIIASMTLEEKVGQLLMIGFGGTQVTPHIRKWIRDRHVGGVALFSRNIVDFEQTVRFTRELHQQADGHIPIFIALDQEGGNVVRVKDGAIILPGNMALGASRSPTLAYVAGQSLAIDLRLLGFNMNLAPVLDINSNPQNPVIGIRSYGERPELVGELGTWYVRGQQEMGVVAVAKHFPGHGDTQSDSHFAMPAIDADLSRLEAVELWPFRRAMDAGLDAVMTAHIALPQIAEESHLPATLSRTILTRILRKGMGFQGVVITDGLEMQGIVEQYGSGRAAVMAVQAGADMPMILWTIKKKEEVYRTLLKAVRNGEISRKRLDRSVRRILTVKARRGLFDRDIEPLKSVLASGNDNPVHDQVSTRIAREAVTLVRNHADVLPIRSVRYRKITVVAPPGGFGAIMAREPNVEVLTVPYIPNRTRRREDVARAVKMAKESDLLVLAVVNRYHMEMARRITSSLPHLPVALLSFASPYYLMSLPDVDAYVCTYSYLEMAQVSAAHAVLGQVPMTGRLPISIPGFYPYGHRVESPVASLPTVSASVR